MHLLLLGYDYKEEGTLNRRMEARGAHLELAKRLNAQGILVQAGAMVEEEKMVGSMIVYNVDSRAALEEILKEEPYLLQNVWEKVIVKEIKLASF